MTGVAAFTDLVINRVLLPLGIDVWSHDALVGLDRWGAFARNLSVVSALVALSFCLASFSSRKSALPISARAGIASFGWVLVPIVALMTFLPRSYTRVELVLAVAGLAHAVASFSGIVSMIVSLVGGRIYWAHTDRLSNAFRWSGELAYLAVPLAIGLAVAIPWREAAGKATLVLSGLAAGVVAIGMAVWKYAVGQDLPDLLYGTVRVDFLPEDDFILYAIPLGIGAAVTVTAMLSKDPVDRQMGAALLLLLSAGYAPRTPSALIVTVLGVALLSRTGIALAQRRREQG
jgi:hypothetical protein